MKELERIEQVQDLGKCDRLTDRQTDRQTEDRQTEDGVTDNASTREACASKNGQP